MTVVMYRSQQHGRRGQRIDTRGPGSEIVISIWGKFKLVAFFLEREFDGFQSLSLLVESKVSLNSCYVLVSLFFIFFFCIHTFKFCLC